MAKSRVCTRCEKRKPLRGFPKATKERLGVAAQCLRCKQAEYSDNRISRTATMRRWYRENRDKQLEYHKEYYKLHKERVLRNVGLWQAENTEKVKEYKRKSRKLNKYTSREACQRRRARIRGVGYNIVDKYAWEFIVAAWNNSCVYCGSPENLTQDHIVPVSKGGWHDLDNLVPACVGCNSKKGSTIIYSVMRTF